MNKADGRSRQDLLIEESYGRLNGHGVGRCHAATTCRAHLVMVFDSELPESLDSSNHLYILGDPW